MDFKDFCNTPESKQVGDKKVTPNVCYAGESLNVNNDKTVNIESMIEDYSKLGQEELLQEFLKESLVAKESGFFDDDKIGSMRSILEPFLNNEQKKYFENFMEMVKK